MGQKSGQPDQAGLLVDRGGLDGCDFVLAERLADNIKPTGERGIAEGPVSAVRKR
jgi:hypothetical protein